MKSSYFLNSLLLVLLLVLSGTGIIEIKTALFIAVFFLFTSLVALLSDRYQNK
tara:strand:- start:3060 stop:3218 length:159 start_codon:yes stop_codon:yes gene_type:complete